ncbi:hypothetical protein E1B28_002121 [Marasmius oreades]|uniref:F-box domain-containing protein n=1 Tax=Marasmius oreades TaxID=181124 RepID=A0A9P7RMF5_9AGAR|nr:uncharacterized protein E1B28_002121 [Marasmius oreades]KAG7086160.1 hypothetical protein E1B28_002121 [Marasmius oreades]
MLNVDPFLYVASLVLPSNRNHLPSPPSLRMDTSLGDRRTSLLDLESKLLHELSVVRSNLNQLCPIISLFPTEIFQIIFAFCGAHENIRSKYRLAFTQVCRHWRTLSLGMPSLWSTIDLSDLPYAALCLSRSGEASVSLVSTTCTEFVGGVAMAEARNRICKIDVVSFPNSMLRLFCSIVGFACEFPNPKMSIPGNLELANLNTLALRIPTISDPVDLSPFHLGSVKRLSLSGVGVCWETTSSDLKVLELSRLPGHLAPTMEELLGIFERAKESIEGVYLEDVSSTGVDEFPPWTERIQAPCLRKFSVSSRSREFVEAIVSVLTIGPHTEVVVGCGGMRMVVVDGKLVDPEAKEDDTLDTQESNAVVVEDRYPF